MSVGLQITALLYLAGLVFVSGFGVADQITFTKTNYTLIIVTAVLWPLAVFNYLLWVLTGVNIIAKILKAVGE